MGGGKGRHQRHERHDVTEVTSGDGYAAAQKALSGETAAWKLYRVVVTVEDAETAPQGQVKLSFPCAQEPKVYRVNDSGTKVTITGEYKDGYYVFNTSRLGLFAIVGGSFTDVPDGAYYEQAITWALTHQPQVTNGTGGGQFSPNATVDRGQTVTFLWRAAGCPEPTGTINPFTDVKSTDYYYKAVLWAVETGVTNGTSATTFSPKDPVKRNQVVTFLWRTLGEPGKTGAGAWYADAENWANANGLLTGTAQSYTGGADCPRCDVVLYLWRALAG